MKQEKLENFNKLVEARKLLLEVSKGSYEYAYRLNPAVDSVDEVLKKMYKDYCQVEN